MMNKTKIIEGVFHAKDDGNGNLVNETFGISIPFADYGDRVVVGNQGFYSKDDFKTLVEKATRVLADVMYDNIDSVTTGTNGIWAYPYNCNPAYFRYWDESDKSIQSAFSKAFIKSSKK